MKSNRRKFLQTFAAGSAFAALGLGAKLLASNPVERKESPLSHRNHLDGDAFWDEIRNEFTLSNQIYLNTGTLGLMPKSVIASVNKRIEALGTGQYAIDEHVRQSVASMMNAKVEEISLMHNTSEGINVIAAGLRLKKGDEVILTDQEHVGNALPWLNRARLDGIRIRVFTPAATASQTLERIAAIINRKTKVIAVPHITCTAGHVLPAKEIATLAHEKGVLSFFDGAHGPGMLFPDMAAIGCDYYAACGHKWLCGPAGTGMLYLRSEMMERVEARMVGAYSDKGWEVSMLRQKLDGLVNTAHRYDYGTQNAALLVGLDTAIKFMEEIGLTKLRERILSLGEYVQGKLLERPYIEMLTPTESISRAGIIGFKLKGKALKDLEKSDLLKRFRIRQVQESGLESLRISTHLYTSFTDLDEFVDELDRFMLT